MIFICISKHHQLNHFENVSVNNASPHKSMKIHKINCTHPDSQSATWVINVIRNVCWICHVLLVSRWLSMGEGWWLYGWRDSWRPLQNLVDWLHVQENACSKRILNQHSLLPCQCRTEPELGQNASAANRYKHLRQWENYISMGAPDELGNRSFHGND